MPHSITMRLLPLLTLACAATFGISCAAAEQPSFLLIQATRLADLKAGYRANQDGRDTGALRPGARELAKKLIENAEKDLKAPQFTIARDPYKLSKKAEGVDPHDYYSLAPYYWPDPTKPNGIPYIRKDGERNPECKSITDHAQVSGLADAVTRLTLAYHLTGEEKYADAAAHFLRTFFLDPATGMNPNLSHAQAVRGVNTGRGIGIIDTLCFHQLPDSLSLLSPSRHWTQNDRAGMKSWCRQFSDWLMNSKMGREERDAANNHGTNYDLQLAGMLTVAGDGDAVTKLLANSVPRRLMSQITKDGEMPLEEARRTSWHYCNFNLRSLSRLAVMGQSRGLNLWGFEASNGTGSIRKAMLFLIPFIDQREKWNFQEISDFKSDGTKGWLAPGAVAYRDPVIGDAQKQYAPLNKLGLMDWLTVPDSATVR